MTLEISILLSILDILVELDGDFLVHEHLILLLLIHHHLVGAHHGLYCDGIPILIGYLAILEVWLLLLYSLIKILITLNIFQELLLLLL